jgi:hypothetical protein
VQYQQQQKANAAQRSTAEEAEKSQAEARAQQASDAAEQRRTQVRSERVRRAQILQSASNTGADESSGEAGATGSLSTQLSSNMGQIAGTAQRANNMSIFQQNAADYQSEARQSMFTGQLWGQVGQIGSSAFTANGGFKAFSRTV